MVNIQWYGAAGEVTGSKILVSNREEKILLDCGMWQGHKDEAYLKNKDFCDNIPEVDKVILSHAHIDHSGLLPALSRSGYSGPIYSTPATAKLCKHMLKDSAKVYLKELPTIAKMLKKKRDKTKVHSLYEESDVSRCLEQFSIVDYEESINISDTSSFSFYDSCHILGSASTRLEINNDGDPVKLWYTSDLGHDSSLLCNEPEIPLDINNIIIESTYGNRDRDINQDVYQEVMDYVNDAHRRGGRTVIPAFSVGRMQQMILIVHKLQELGLIPVIPVYVDSPLGVKVTHLHEVYESSLNRATINFFTERGLDPFNAHNINYITSPEDSKAVSESDEQCIVISASGMCEGGHIREHIKGMCGDKNSTILFVGYNAESTLGRRLQESNGSVNIDGKNFRVRCKVETIHGLSAHADLSYLTNYIKHIVDSNNIHNIFLVHGEVGSIKNFKNKLIEMGIETNIIIPKSGVSYKL
jgi:metallo-beta-lactamase family protein